MTTKGKGFVGQSTPRIIDTAYEQCNFMSRSVNEIDGLKVGIRIFPGDDTPRTFLNCNLINRIVPPGSTIINCNTSIIEYDVVTSTETVQIGSEVISIDNKSNFCHGFYDPETLSPDYKQVPDEIPQERAV